MSNIKSILYYTLDNNIHTCTRGGGYFVTFTPLDQVGLSFHKRMVMTSPCVENFICNVVHRMLR